MQLYKNPVVWPTKWNVKNTCFGEVELTKNCIDLNKTINKTMNK